MHELSICQALVAQVAAIAAERQLPSVSDIHIGVGPLSGVEARLLSSAFPVAAAGTVASGAALHVRTTAIAVRCLDCASENVARASRLTCDACGSWRTALAGGDELVLERVVLSHRAANDRDSGHVQ